MYNKKVVYRITAAIALAGLMFGVDVGVMSGVLPLMSKTLNLNTQWTELITSIMLLGAAIGGLISKSISYKIGRRNSIILSGFIFVICFIGSAFSTSKYMLLVYRFILGLGLGIESLNTPLYLAEISPTEIRGKLTGSYQLSITIGILLAFLSDALIGGFITTGHLTESHAWRLMLLVVIIPAIAMIICVWTTPKSPRWLILRGRHAEAVEVLRYLGNEDAQQEVVKITENVNYGNINWRMLLNRRFLYIIFIGIGLQLIQQFCCKNMLNYYAPELFGQIGFKSHDAQMWVTTLVVGVTSIIFTFIAMHLVDKLGRKTLLYISGVLILIGSLMVSIAFVPQFAGNLKAIIGVSAIFVFMVGYGIGYGPVVWISCAEIFPLEGKELGMSFVVMSNWIGNFFVGMVTLSMLRGLGAQKFFLVIVIVQVISLLFIKFFVPETKNKSLEEIENELFKKA